MRVWRWLMLVLALMGCDTAPLLKNGDPAPAFALENLAGQTVRLPDDLKGKPTVLRFWADWCPYCRGEMKDIESVFQAHKATGLTILAINVGQERETAQRFMDSLQVSYPALLDPGSQTARKYGVLGLPTTYLVDRQGRIQAKILGETSREGFERMVTALLATPP